jgi:DNA mismatch endonuclease (patch repair protein)
MDVVDAATRSRMMAGIRGKNTSAEVALRRELHRLGFRFSLHRKNLPGKPDIVFRKYGAVIFVNGCFWHGHDCHLFRWPKTRSEFWRAKIQSNMARDAKNLELLRDAGWRVGVLWECSWKGSASQSIDTLANRCSKWLAQPRQERLEIRG